MKSQRARMTKKELKEPKIVVSKLMNDIIENNGAVCANVIFADENCFQIEHRDRYFGNRCLTTFDYAGNEIESDETTNK